MNDKEKIEALCAVIEEILELVQDETAAECYREKYRQAVACEDAFEDERWN
jgi:hypothetical protein